MLGHTTRPELVNRGQQPWLTVMFTTAGAALAAASAMKWGPRTPGGGVAGLDSPPDKMLGVGSAGMEWA